MLSFQHREEVETLLGAFDEADAFFSVLNTLTSQFEGINNYLLEIGVEDISELAGMPVDIGHPNIGAAVEELWQHLSNLNMKSEEYSTREFYRSLETFQERLRSHPSSTDYEQQLVGDLLVEINDFSDQYEKSNSSHVPTLIAASKLSQKTDCFKTALLLAESRFLEEDKVETTYEGSDKLSILLTSSMSITAFGQKLISIETVYNEVCRLTGVSTTDFPLEIKKIESGSLWAEFLGNEKVIALIVGLISSAATYLYTTHTNQGKLKTIPKKVDSINDILQLTSKLEEAGVDTSTTKENLSKAAILLSHELNEILSKESEIIINKKRHIASNEVKEKLIESQKSLKLEHDDKGAD